MPSFVGFQLRIAFMRGLLILGLAVPGAAGAFYVNGFAPIGSARDLTQDIFTGPDQFGCNYTGQYAAIKDAWLNCLNAKANSNVGPGQIGDPPTLFFENFRNLRPFPTYPLSVVAGGSNYSMLIGIDMYSWSFVPPASFVKVITSSNENFALGSTRSTACPAGTTLQAGLCVRNANDWDRQKNEGDDCEQSCGNPMNQGTGAKLQVETDYRGGSRQSLDLVRYYSSSGTLGGQFGAKWRSNFDTGIGYSEGGGVNAAAVWLASGKTLYFVQSGGDWISDSDVDHKLAQFTDNSGGTPVVYWHLAFPDGRTETFHAASGKLVASVDADGYGRTFAYSALEIGGRLQSVTDSFGRTLQFAYDAGGRVATATDPSGGVFQYAYDGNGNPSSVTAPDSSVRQYVYDVPATGALNGIIDENGDRYATWSYDAEGRVIASEHAGGAERVTVAYQGNNSLVTDALGAQRTYSLVNILGMRKTATVTGAPCTTARCGDAARTHDANGNIATRTDFNGRTKPD